MKVELLVMAILLSKIGRYAQYDDRARPRGMTTARPDDRAAVGWAWTGRNLILDEALGREGGRGHHFFPGYA